MWRLLTIAVSGSLLAVQNASPDFAAVLARHVQNTQTAFAQDDAQYFSDKADVAAAVTTAFVLSAADAVSFADFAQELGDIRADQEADASTASPQAAPKITPVMIRDNLQGKGRIIAAAESAGRQTNLPPSYMAAMAVIESSINPSARRCQRNGCDGAVGLYQFVGDTGRRYGLVTGGADHRTNAAASIRAAALLARDNRAALVRAGIPITGANLYMAHQQGSDGAIATYRLAHGMGLRAGRGLMHNIGNNLPGNIRRQYFNGLPNGKHKFWVLKPGVSATQAATAFYRHWDANYARFEAAVNRTFAGQLREVWA
ncbi:MAG: transglycosylase SLT domain-containing protein [Thiothrix sp.]|uniref:transglycosylase SLT domain-containing protein n=1 Tax=Thiothrix sp. TaxID=1032 RepID=UPI00260B068C|nr:transglycosylase SLT domain-containing protein [Thiothrix sp.]MDD5392868.1 transglycosylase SLT domain-containing protein [Thiothrix sp.]MDD5394667.1 transglycosylase SLT domain-containing protein [Thiothrix sp.]